MKKRLLVTGCVAPSLLEIMLANPNIKIADAGSVAEHRKKQEEIEANLWEDLKNNPIYGNGKPNNRAARRAAARGK